MRLSDYILIITFMFLVLGCKKDDIQDECLCDLRQEGYIEYNVKNDSVFDSFTGKLTQYETYESSSVIEFGVGYYIINIRRMDLISGNSIGIYIYLEPGNIINSKNINFEIYHKQDNSFYKLKNLLGDSKITNFEFNSTTLECKGEFEYVSENDMNDTLMVSGSFNIQLIENKTKAYN